MTSAVAVDGNVRAVVLALMAARDLSRDDLARGTGMHPGTVRRRLSRTAGLGHSWTAAEVQALSDLFGVPVTVFYGGPEALFGDGYRGTTRRQSGDSAAIPAQRHALAA